MSKSSHILTELNYVYYDLTKFTSAQLRYYQYIPARYPKEKKKHSIDRNKTPILIEKKRNNIVRHEYRVFRKNSCNLFSSIV